MFFIALNHLFWPPTGSLNTAFFIDEQLLTYVHEQHFVFLHYSFTLKTNGI